jgi:hypothetical protein
MSDWGATHSASIMQGLDQEMPGGKYMGAPLAAMVASGEVPMSKVLWTHCSLQEFSTGCSSMKHNLNWNSIVHPIFMTAAVLFSIQAR